VTVSTVSHDVAYVPGDDSGPELVDIARDVVDVAAAASGARIRWIACSAGRSAWEQTGDNLPAETISTIRQLGVALKGPTTTGMGTGLRSANIRLRHELDLYACLRPSRAFPGIPARRADIDVTVVRENMEDLYAGVETVPGSPSRPREVTALAAAGIHLDPGQGATLRPASGKATARVARVAARVAAASLDRTLHVAADRVHAPVVDGYFADGVREAAHASHPSVRVVELSLTEVMRRIATGSLNGVVVLNNLMGDIASDVAAATVGGLGVGPGVNLGDNCAVFEATHGSAPEWAGRDVLNPTALLLSGAMLLEHLDLGEAAALLRGALTRVLSDPANRTADLLPGGLGRAHGRGSREFGSLISDAVRCGRRS